MSQDDAVTRDFSLCLAQCPSAPASRTFPFLALSLHAEVRFRGDHELAYCRAIIRAVRAAFSSVAERAAIPTPNRPCRRKTSRP